MRNSTQTGSKWFVCARCGFDYPEKYKRRQNGQSVCTFIPCYDEPGGQSEEPQSRPPEERGMRVHVGFD